MVRVRVGVRVGVRPTPCLEVADRMRRGRGMASRAAWAFSPVFSLIARTLSLIASFLEEAPDETRPLDQMLARLEALDLVRGRGRVRARARARVRARARARVRARARGRARGRVRVGARGLGPFFLHTLETAWWLRAQVGVPG